MIAYLIVAGALLVPAAFLLFADAPEGGGVIPPAEPPPPGGPPVARLLPAEKRPGIRFRWWHGLVALGLFFGLQVFVGAAYMVVTGRRTVTDVVPLVVLVAVADVLLTGVIAAAAWLLYGSARRGLGLVSPKRLREWLWVPFGLGLTLAVTYGYDLLLGFYGMRLEQQLAIKIAELRGAGPWIAVMLCVGLLVPIGEEVVFRACMYAGFKKGLGSFWAALLSALAFMAVHVEPVAFPPLFIIGMVTAFVYERTRSLYVPIAVHVLNNCTTLTLIALS